MTSFQSLLSSIGGGQPKPPQLKTSGASLSASGTLDSTRPQMPPLETRPSGSNVAAGVKRKPVDQAGPSQPKTVRTVVKVPVRPISQNGAPSAAKGATTPYRGTARPSGSGSAQPVKPAPKPAVARPSSATTGTTTSTTDGTSKPKRGFAAIMEKAKAAEEAAKAAGSSMIKHKTVEKVSKRERERERERAQQIATASGNANGNGKSGARGARAGVLADRSRSGTPNAVGPGVQKKGPEIAYKGTMKGPVRAMPEIAYKGTMRKSIPGEQSAKQAAKKGMAQDKYGGYASWSDLSGAEDEEEDYDSDGSSMMEAGLDDVEAEETMALRAARREDREAMEEEERLRREKNERKKKLEALNKSAAARKKY